MGLDRDIFECQIRKSKIQDKICKIKNNYENMNENQSLDNAQHFCGGKDELNKIRDQDLYLSTLHDLSMSSSDESTTDEEVDYETTAKPYDTGRTQSIKETKKRKTDCDKDDLTSSLVLVCVPSPSSRTKRLKRTHGTTSDTTNSQQLRLVVNDSIDETAVLPSNTVTQNEEPTFAETWRDKDELDKIRDHELYESTLHDLSMSSSDESVTDDESDCKTTDKPYYTGQNQSVEQTLKRKVGCDKDDQSSSPDSVYIPSPSTKTKKQKRTLRTTSATTKSHHDLLSMLELIKQPVYQLLNHLISRRKKKHRKTQRFYIVTEGNRTTIFRR